MKIYEYVEPVPSRIYGLVHLLSDSGRRGLKEIETIALMQPPTLRDDNKESPIAPNTVAAALEIGIIERRSSPDGEMLALSESAYAALHKAASLADALPRFLGNILLRPRIGDSENRFATVCAWMLAQSATWMPQGHGDFQTQFARHLDLNTYRLTNTSNLDNVIYWAKYLGLIWKAKEAGGKGIVPDPTRFLKWCLDDILPRDGLMEMGAFRRRVGEVCPVLDGGEVRSAVLEKMRLNGAPPWPEEHLSDALTMAVRALAHEGLIRYAYDDDARNFTIMSRGERVKTIERL